MPRGCTRCGSRYDDPGQSGERFDRPALQALLRDIEAGGISHLIVYRLDGLSRRLADTVRVFAPPRRHHVDLDIVTAPHLGESASDQFMLSMLASFAEFEHGLISERIRESVRARRRGGRRLSGKPPFGYDLDKATKGLILNDGEARKVSEFFRLAAAGQTPRQIAADANKRRWATKTYVSRSTAKPLGGNPWTARQILELLRNPVYAGCLRDEEELAADPDTTPEVRQALATAVQLIAELRLPDPCMTIGDIIERTIFSRDSIRVAFSDSALQDLLLAPPCEPRFPLTGGLRDTTR